MRVTKTRIMRSKTINPNPPICRSKEPSFTFITIYSCETNEVLNRIEHYNWNLTQAKEAANGGNGTYSLGYFYEAAFSKYTDLGQDHCLGLNYLSVTGEGGEQGYFYYTINLYQKRSNYGLHLIYPHDAPMSRPFNTWTLQLDTITFYPDKSFEMYAKVDCYIEMPPQEIYGFGYAELNKGDEPNINPLVIKLPEPTWP